jgi:NAD(P)-dependent dehydrogenase (short-subunit alcohol dehydrogenase family)
MSQTERRVAVVSGANRGIGNAIARQLAEKGLHVVLTARREGLGREACAELQKDGLAASFFSLDVTSDESVAALAAHVRRDFGRLDVLVNNAGVALDKWVPALEGTMESFITTYETNVFGVVRMCRALIPIMREGGYGRVVNLSSNLGSMEKIGGRTIAYRTSKTAVNAITRVIAAELTGGDILVNSMCPGWVKTELGGADAPRSTEEAADTAIWLATLPPGGPTGGFFQDRKPFPL